MVTLSDIVEVAGMHQGPRLTGATFASVFVLFARSASGGLVGVWYHPNRAACDHKAAELFAAMPHLRFEVVEYTRKGT